MHGLGVVGFVQKADITVKCVGPEVVKEGVLETLGEGENVANLLYARQLGLE